MAARWIDLLDPSAEQLRDNAPRDLEETAVELLLADPKHEDEPRPTLQGHGDYVFGIFLLAVAVPEEDRIFYQQVGLVITHDTLLTVRKTPPGGGEPYGTDRVREQVRPDDSAGMIASGLVDD